MIAVVDPKTKARAPGDSHVLFENASWELYEAILKQYDELPQRINYDNGVVELMTLSREHEQFSRFIASMVVMAAMERRIPIANCGSNTLKQMEELKGLEPDACFYVANEQAVRGKRRIDLAINPPPDLVIEVDITHRVVDREAIYADFGVPEMWRFDGKKLTAHKLSRGQWRAVDASVAFPFLRPAELLRFLKKLKKTDETSVLIEFRDWLRTL